MFIGYSDIVGVRQGDDNSYNLDKGPGDDYLSTGSYFSHKHSSGMAYERDQTKSETILRPQHYSFHLVPSLRTRSLEIPPSDGHHESLCLHICQL